MTKIKFFKILTSILACSAFALLYVHQEVEIVRTSVLINKNRRDVSFRLDQYRTLVYNLSRLESPKRVEDTLSVNEIVLCMPRLENKRSLSQIELAYSEEAPKKESLLARMFDRLSTKAEAKVVK